MALSEALNRAIRDALWKSDFRLAEFEASADGRTVRFLASTLLQRRLAGDLAVDQAALVSSPGAISEAALTEIITSGEGDASASAVLERTLREQAAAAAPAGVAPLAGGIGEMFLPKRVVTAKAVSAGSNPVASEVVNERVFMGRVSGVYVKLDTGTEVSGGIRISAFKGSGFPPLAFDDTREDDLFPLGNQNGTLAPWGGLGHLGIGTSASTPGVRFEFNLLYEIDPPVRFVIRVVGATDRAAAIFELGDLASGVTAIQQVTNNITESIIERAVETRSSPPEREFIQTIMFDPKGLRPSFVALRQSAFNAAVATGFRADGAVPSRDVKRTS